MSDFISVFELRNDAITNQCSSPLSQFVFMELTAGKKEKASALCLERLANTCLSKAQTIWDKKRRPVGRCVSHSIYNICKQHLFDRRAVAIAIGFAVLAISTTCLIISQTSESREGEPMKAKSGFKSSLFKAGNAADRVRRRHVSPTVVAVRCLNELSTIPSYAKQLDFCGSGRCTAPGSTQQALLADLKIEEVHISGTYNPNVLLNVLQNLGKNLLALEIDFDALCGKTSVDHRNLTQDQLLLPSLLRLTIRNSKRCSLGDIGFELNVPMLRHLRLQNSALDNNGSLIFARLLDTAADSIEQIFVSKTTFPPFFHLSPGRFPNLQIFDFPPF